MRQLQVICVLSSSLLLWLLGCTPEFVVDSYSVSRLETLHCTALGDAPESCQEPLPQRHTLPLVVETRADRITVYLTGAETGSERVFVARADADPLLFQRSQQSRNDAGGCNFQQVEELLLLLKGDALTGAERAISEESEGCSAANLPARSRIEWTLQGQRE